MSRLRCRPESGHTLVELLLASAVLMITLTVAFASLSSSRNYSNLLESRVSSRQELLKLSNYIHRDVRNSAYVFINRNVFIEGVEFEIGGLDEPGRSLILAVPEKLQDHEETYTVIAYYLDETTRDSVNITTRDIIRYEVNHVEPDIPNTPASIELESLSGGSNRVVARYVDPELLSFTVRDNGNRVDINPIATKREISNQKPVQVELFTSVNLRNK